jgi:hypothetical protein
VFLALDRNELTIVEPRRPPIRSSVIAIAAVSLLLAACGSSSPSSTTVSSSDGQSTQVQAQEAVAFSDCMRSHGVSNFPDPGTGSFKYALAPSTPKSPAFQPAYAACQHLLPDGGPSGQSDTHSPAQIAAMLAFVRCLRRHGFTSFPDPTSTGDLTHEMVANAGINLHQPAVLQAGDACVGVTHGFVTRANVARFVAGQ